MTQADGQTVVVRLPLGTFGHADSKDPARWLPNPFLQMTAQRQFNHNVDAGFLRLNTPEVVNED